MDKFSNKIVGENAKNDIKMSDKAFVAPKQNVSVDKLKKGVVENKSVKIVNNDKFDNIPRGECK